VSTQTTRHLHSYEGKTYQLGRITIIFKTAASEGSVFTLCEAIEPPGSGASRHRHGYDEAFRILEGRYEFELGVNGEERRELGPGETLFVPRGTAHAFKSLGPESGRQLIISTPAGIFHAFIEDVAGAMALSSPSKLTVDFRGIAARHGIEFLS
jgi:mannose-6-phosphate isomerase-like protein (cupin superfamily)